VEVASAINVEDFTGNEGGAKQIEDGLGNVFGGTVGMEWVGGVAIGEIGVILAFGGENKAWRNGVDANSWCQFQRQHLGEAEKGSLGEVVGGVEPVVAVNTRIEKVDNVPFLVLGLEGPCQLKGGHGVNLHIGLKLGRAELQEVARIEDGGVVDQGVNGADLILGLWKKGFYGGRIPQVGAEGLGVPPVSDEFVGQGLGFILGAVVVDDNLHARLAERAGYRGTDSSCSPGHQGGLSF
jgi:hypothetical protein